MYVSMQRHVNRLPRYKDESGFRQQNNRPLFAECDNSAAPAHYSVLSTLSPFPTNSSSVFPTDIVPTLTHSSIAARTTPNCALQPYLCTVDYINCDHFPSSMIHLLEHC